jgi:hypothetical protein
VECDDSVQVVGHSEAAVQKKLARGNFSPAFLKLALMNGRAPQSLFIESLECAKPASNKRNRTVDA